MKAKKRKRKTSYFKSKIRLHLEDSKEGKGNLLSNNNKLVSFCFNLTFMMLQYNSQLNVFFRDLLWFLFVFFCSFFLGGVDLVKITKELNQFFINLPLERQRLKQF